MRTGSRRARVSVERALLLALLAVVLVLPAPWPLAAHAGMKRAPSFATQGTRLHSSLTATHVLGPSTAAHRFDRPATSPPRNVLVVGGCALVGNAEVESAFDPVAGILYDAWIGCGGIGFARSLDGGYSFSSGITVPGSSGGSIGQAWDPAIALAPNGTVYVAFMVYDGTGDAPVVAWSWNHGVGFAGSQFAFRSTSTEFSDREFIAVAPSGTVVLTWNYAPNGSLVGFNCPPGGSCYFTSGDFNAVLVRSLDGGRNWTSPIHLDPEYPWGGAVAAPLVVEPNGTVDVLYEDYNVTPAHVLSVGYNYFTASFDGGLTFQPRVRVSGLGFSYTDWWIDGAIAEDNSRTLYASFDANVAGHDYAYVALSTTHGSTWSTPVRLNNDTNSGLHIEVGVAGGENGTVYAAWMSNATGGGWATYSVTLSGNGTSLTPPTLLSAGVGLNGFWVGDTIGLAYLGAGGVAICWSYALNSTLGTQVYGAVLGVPPPGTPRQAKAVPGPAQVTVSWLPPGDRWVAGYTVAWGVEGQTSSNLSVVASALSVVVRNLTPSIHFFFQVSAFNAGGAGPPTGELKITLIGWGLIKGTVVPATSTIQVDNHPFPVTQGQYVANVTPGVHLVQASDPTFANADNVTVAPWNGSVWVNLTLAPLPGTLAGSVSPHTASVTWDGGGLAVNPLGRFSVQAPAGSVHVLGVTALGYNPVQLNESLPQGGTVYVNLTLSLLNGTVALSVAPAAASVWLNGTHVRLDGAGAALVSVGPGRYSLTASESGYETYATNVSVRPGERVPLNISLVPVVSGGSSQIAGLSTGTFDLLVIFGVTAVVVAAVAVVAFRRRPPPEPGLGEDEQGPAAPSDIYEDDFPPNLGEPPEPDDADWRYA